MADFDPEWRDDEGFEDDVEVEIVAEGCKIDEELRKRFKACGKYVEHTQFSPMSEFNVQHLPAAWRDSRVGDCVGALSKMVVKLLVTHTSEDRPDDYDRASSGLKGTTTTRVGTGLALIDDTFLEKPNQPCELPDCKVKKGRHNVTATFKVQTVAHVSFVNSECQKTTVVFFEDSDDHSKTQVVTAQGQSVSNSQGMFGESCTLDCVSHDLDLFHKVLDFPDYVKEEQPPLDLDHAHGKRDPLVVVISHPHGLTKHVTCGDWTDVVGAERMIAKEAVKVSEKMFPMLSLVSPFHPSENQPGLSPARPPQSSASGQNKHPTEEDIQRVAHVIRMFGQMEMNKMNKMIDNLAPFLQMLTPGAELRNTSTNNPMNTDNPHQTVSQFYNEDLLLRFSYMTYSAHTCPGSSGAPVFVFYDTEDGGIGVECVTSHFGMRGKKNASAVVLNCGSSLKPRPALRRHIQTLREKKVGNGKTAHKPKATTKTAVTEPPLD